MFNIIKHWLIVHCAEFFKTATSFIMFFTAGLMWYDYVSGTHIIPEYFHFTSWDFQFWLVMLVLSAILQLTMLLNVKCVKCRLISDLMLQLSGLLLLIIGWAFIAKYPPLHILMIIYPTWGMAMVILGRHMGKRSRKRCYGMK